MADSLHVVITKLDGTVVDITGTLANSIITETAPPPPPPTISSVQVSGAASTVASGATAQFSATVQGTGAFSPSVTWKASAGIVDVNGLLIAPAAAATVTVTAASVQDPTKTGVATIAVQAPPPPPPPPPSLEPVIPATADMADLLPAITPWLMNHDAGTPGSSTGTTTYPFTAPDGSTVRLFDMTEVAKGGEIYHVNAGHNPNVNCFCYETVESSPDWSNVACAEKDLEHADATGTYVDMATQLSAYSGTVEVTGGHKWQATVVKADPSKRAANVLHTTRIHVKDNGNGTSTYRGIFLDGVYYPINVTLNDTGSSKWGKNVLNLQLQYDSKVSGTVEIKIYLHLLRVHAWKE